MQDGILRIANRAAVKAALLLFLAAFMSIAFAPVAEAFRKDKLTLRTASGEHVIEIEVAETSEQKSLGLMHRQKVPPNTGMLFPYDRPQELTMWMRNTYVSLDMIFIRADGSVHRIEYGTEPLSERVIGSGGPVTAVLELAAGEAKRLGLRPGDQVIYRTFKSTR